MIEMKTTLCVLHTRAKGVRSSKLVRQDLCEVGRVQARRWRLEVGDRPDRGIGEAEQGQERMT